MYQLAKYPVAAAAAASPSLLSNIGGVGTLISALILGTFTILVLWKSSNHAARTKAFEIQAKAIEALQANVEALETELRSKSQEFTHELRETRERYEKRIADLEGRSRELEARAIRAETQVAELRRYTQPEMAVSLIEQLRTYQEAVMAAVTAARTPTEPE